MPNTEQFRRTHQHRVATHIGVNHVSTLPWFGLRREIEASTLTDRVRIRPLMGSDLRTAVGIHDVAGSLAELVVQPRGRITVRDEANIVTVGFIRD